MGKGLAEMPWDTAEQVVGLSAQEQQLLLRLKVHKLSAYDDIAASSACPFPACDSTKAATLGHIFWSCPNANVRWLSLQRRWTSAGARFSRPLSMHCFGLSPPTVPTDAATKIIDMAQHNDTTTAALDSLPGITTTLWKYECASMAGIWRLRHLVMDGGTGDSNEVEARQEAVVRTGHLYVRRVILQYSTSN